MIVVCLDDAKSVTRGEASWNCWVGDGRNRFYDKHQRMRFFFHFRPKVDCFIVIVFENGKSGFLGEHSYVDGVTNLRFNEFTLASSSAKEAEFIPPKTPGTGTGLPTPTELKFVRWPT